MNRRASISTAEVHEYAASLDEALCESPDFGTRCTASVIITFCSMRRPGLFRSPMPARA